MALISTKCWHQLVQTALLRFANTAMRINQHANRKRMEATSYRVNALVLYCSHQDCSETKPSNSRAPFLGFSHKKKKRKANTFVSAPGVEGAQSTSDERHKKHRRASLSVSLSHIGRSHC